MLLRSPASNSPVKYARSGSRRSAWPIASLNNPKYSSNRSASGHRSRPMASVSHSGTVLASFYDTVVLGAANLTRARSAIIDLGELARFERPLPVMAEYDRLLSQEVVP